jgi:hypothetical protein
LEEIKKLFDKKEKPDIDELYKQNKKILDIIKEKLFNNERKLEEFIETFIRYFNICENKELIDDLTILFKSKKYEKDINSIIFFFSYFEKDNKKWNEILSEKKYKDLSNYSFEDILKKLKELEDNEIYNYKEIKKYNELFTCLFEKNEALEFLIEKIGQNIDDLKDRILTKIRKINKISDKMFTIDALIEYTTCLEESNVEQMLGTTFQKIAQAKNKFRNGE